MNESNEVSIELVLQPETIKLAVESGQNFDHIVTSISDYVRAIEDGVDTTTRKGRQSLISLAAKVSSSKVLLINTAKSELAAQEASIKTIKGYIKAAETTLNTLRDDTRAPVTEWEENQKRILKVAQEAAEWAAMLDEAYKENNKITMDREDKEIKDNLARYALEELAEMMNDSFDRRAVQKQLEREEDERTRKAQIAAEEANRVAQEEIRLAQKELKEMHHEIALGMNEKHDIEQEAFRVTQLAEDLEKATEEAYVMYAQIETANKEAQETANKEAQETANKEAQETANKEAQEAAKIGSYFGSGFGFFKEAQEAAKKTRDDAHSEAVNMVEKIDDKIIDMMIARTVDSETACSLLSDIKSGHFDNLKIDYCK